MALDLTTAAEAISEASSLFAGLKVGLPDVPDFPEPPTITLDEIGELPSDLIDAVAPPTVAELTQGAVAGDGIFDKIMSTVSAHIESQYTKGIIGKSEVASVYIAAIQSVLPQSVAFLLQSANSYWQARLVQIQAQNAWLERAKINASLKLVQLEIYRTQAEAYTAQVNALTAQTTYTNGKMQLVKTLQDINVSETQEAVAQAQYDAAYVQTHSTLPGGGAVAGAAAAELALKVDQLVIQGKQKNLLDAQTDVQRAQTRNTNADATTVAGVIGVQKDLYNQQIESYVLDGKNKGVKLMADIWTSAKALDDAVESPGPIAGNLMLGMNKYINDLGLPNAAVGADTPASGDPSADTNWNTPGQQT